MLVLFGGVCVGVVTAVDVCSCVSSVLFCWKSCFCWKSVFLVEVGGNLYCREIVVFQDS